MNQNKMRGYTFLLGLSLFILFAFFLFVDYLKKPLPFSLETADGRSTIELPVVSLHKITKSKVLEAKNNILDSSLTSHATQTFDSTQLLKVNAIVIPENLFYKDSTRKRILLFGDSEAEFLRPSIYNYCLKNNFNLVASIVWYSSTTFAWTGDTLDYYMSKYKPDFVIGVLGLNELLTKKLDSRRKCINLIKQKFVSKNIPYYWIGPAGWVPDNGLTKLMQEELGTLFYPSQNLVLERGPDKRHPTFEASKIWFDSVAVKITKHTSFSFVNKVLEYKKVQHSPVVSIGLNKAK